MKAEPQIAIELIYALPYAQEVISLEVPCGTTVAEAIEASGLYARHGITASPAPIGIYGRRVPRYTVLRNGDRVEVYRALIADPKQARRRRSARSA